MLVNNINYLRERYPYIREQLKLIDNNEKKHFLIEETRKGSKTLIFRMNEKETYFHSKYDPEREAENVIEEYKEVKEHSIIFYGTGLGYHIDLLMSENPYNDYYIFEPISELLEQFLSIRDLTQKSYRNLKKLSTQAHDISTDIENIIKSSRKEVKILELPMHKKIYEKEFREFNDMFLKTIKEKRTTMYVEYEFQEGWITNSMRNFGDILKTTNILIEKKGQFKNKTAILVSAGPSLDEEMENLRYIKKNGLAYIFSVGSAIRTFLAHNIYPDAVTTYDPKATNYGVIKSIKDQNIKEIPLIFGSSVGQNTLTNYPGNMYHMITSQDSISDYFLETKSKEEIPTIQDSSSVALITMQLLHEIGFSKVLLVGQNLAYIDKKQYSAGVTYRKELTDSEIGEGITIKDVYGKDILTNETFNLMREEMEEYIKIYSDVQFINTTKGGARIEGAEFKKLEDLIGSDLKENIVEKDWLIGNQEKYSMKYLELKRNDMSKAYKKMLRINKEYYETLNKIEKLLRTRNFVQVEDLYVKLDKQFNEIENNDYYKIFILPMNRVQYKLLVDSIDSLNETKDAYARGKKIIESFKKFIVKCNESIKEIEPIYDEMMKTIERYIEG